MTTIVAAVGANLEIGVRGKLPWYIPEDLYQFKQLTMGSNLIMGRKTWESLPASKLPGRRCIVVTRQHSFAGPDAVVHSLEEALYYAGKHSFVVGGAEIYAQALPFADRMVLSLVPRENKDADSFFPRYNSKQWRKVEERPHYDADGKILFNKVTLERK